MKITFLGATQEVTGSKYLLQAEDIKLLIDCGLFQGGYQATIRNRTAFDFDPATINAVILTHAHIDHTGSIPLLVKRGFKGAIYCSQATYELCKILLVDNGTLQEKTAQEYNERKSSNEPMQQPLYTTDDARYSLNFFQVIDYETPLNLGGLKITLIRCSHILGSTFVVVTDGKTTITFSGDLGGSEQLIMKSPKYITQTDYLVLESTYGDRLHEANDPIEKLGSIINAAVKRKGVVLIPAFAVGRTQTILYCLYQLKQKKIIQDIPIFLDSPLAISVTQLFCDFKQDYTLPVASCKEILSSAKPITTIQESKHLDTLNGPAIIIAGSGMMNGGRMIYHLPHYISNANNTIVLVGYQARETLGNDLIHGVKQIQIMGKSYTVNAHIETIDSFSAHADYKEILKWLEHLEKKPKMVFLTHGELRSAEALQKKIEERFGWKVSIPKYLDFFDLTD